MGTVGSTKSSPGWFKGLSDAPKSSTPPARIRHLAESGTIWVKMLPMPRHGEPFSDMVLWPAPNGGSGALGCSTQPRPCTHLSPDPKTTSPRVEGRARRYRTAGMAPFINTRAPGGPGGREWCAFSIHCALLGRPALLNAAPSLHRPVPGPKNHVRAGDGTKRGRSCGNAAQIIDLDDKQP